MLGRFALFLALFLFLQPVSGVHPQRQQKRPSVGITQKFGVADVACFIPGITKAQVCSTCINVLTAVKAQASGGINLGTNFLTSFIVTGCGQLTGALAPLGLRTLGPFCREAGDKLMTFLRSGSQIPLSFINPQFDCQVATFC
ncbi:hypothetical protein M3Y97_00636300 [Aphelenchoides bicaudatus]|nr:hypothetical protein M3Y97_00636300 [Aphelenchoides bicaudatus]